MKRALLLACFAWAVTASAQVPSYVPTDGLVAWYPMNPNTNEWDSSHPPILDNTVAATDRFGQPDAIGFSGGGLVMGGLLTQVSSTFTYSIWVKNSVNIVLPTSASFQNLGNDHHGVIHPIHGAVYGAHASNAGTGLCVGSNGLYLQEHSHNHQRYAGWASHEFTEWSLVTVVYENNAPSIYINGAWVASFPAGDRTIFPSLGQDTNNYADYLIMGIGQMYNEGTFAGQVDDYGIWNRALTESEVQILYLSAPLQNGCTNVTACNYDAEANVDDGSCIPSGCMDDGACNYNADAECEGEACDYSCCPGPGCCGDGMHWDSDAQTCVITPPSVAPDAECTLLNLQELAEGYQILLAENAELDSLLADCNGTSTSDQSGPCSGENVVTYHGYDYDIVEIGDQCWFAENLRTTIYRSGDAITDGSADGDWSSTNTGAYSNHPSGNGEFGPLYNGHAVMDPRGLCPTDWHVSSNEEWTQLENFLSSNGYSGNEGHSLKSESDWNAGGNGVDAFSFNAKPGGFRHPSGLAVDWADGGNFWSNTENGSELRFNAVFYSYSYIFRSSGDRNLGLSVRCVKD